MAKKSAITPDSLVSAVISDREKKGGHCYRTTEHRDHTFGIDIPNLGMQWLLGGINKLPLGRLIAISGEYGSFKSSLAGAIGGWFMTQNGIFVDIDTEGKKSPTTYESLYHRMDADELGRSIYEAAETPEKWQEIIFTWLGRVKGEEVATLPKGSRIPLFINIDSIIGRSTEGEQVKMEQEGHAAERGYPTINNMIKRFLEGISLIGSTCTIGYITHLKDEINDAGGGMYGKKQKELGGTTPGFYATTIIRSKRGKQIDYVDENKNTVEGYMLTLTGHKVSTGPNGRKLDVPYLWRYVDDPEHPDGFRQEAWFDWDWALGLLLHRIMFNRNFFKASEYPDIEPYLSPKKSGCGSDTSPKFEQTQTLNEGSPKLVDGQVGISELGRAIHGDPEVRRAVQKMLHINLYPDVQEAETLNYREK